MGDAALRQRGGAARLLPSTDVRRRPPRRTAAPTVGVVQSSSEVGCTAPEWEALPLAERHRRAAAARHTFEVAGAHAVLDTLAELPALIVDLDNRLQRGEKP